VTSFQKTLFYAEGRQERLAAALRIVVFLVLLAAVLSLRNHGAHHHPVLNVTLAYGVLAIVGLVFAWKDIYHPLLPFTFLTLEVGLVSVQTILMGSLMGESPFSLAALPVASVIFVILAHASMRYRPWLVLYAAALFLLVLAAAPVFIAGIPPDPFQDYPVQHNVVRHQVLPATMISLTAGILFVTSYGTRKLLRASTTERLARDRLSRFFAPDIAKRLTETPDEDSARGGVQETTVLFADIRGFSSIAEGIPPEELTGMLGEFREIVAGAIQDHDGVVDKFIGDAVLAVFGYPGPDKTAAGRGLSCAISILEKLDAWSRERRARGRPAIRVGIGLHYGEAFVGVVGRESLLEFTVIGDTVNIAERIERLTRKFGADIAVSRAFADAAQLDWRDKGWHMAEGQPLAGHRRPIDVLYLRTGEFSGNRDAIGAL
tara:strand:- start:986 stop:2281 length:1296 start_codon:yes stop_codon:yes gene_type:complete